MSKIRKAPKWEKYWLLTTLWLWEIRRQWKRTRRYEKCTCDCWNIIFVPYTSLRSWHTQSCWCIRKISSPKKWTRFGRWTTLGEWEIKSIGTQWGRWRFEKCICDCWTIRLVSYQLLKNWHSLSCWCYHSDKMKEVSKDNFKTHWLSKTRIYKIFRWIYARCNNPQAERYKHYWWRWIECLRNSFENFYKDMGPSYEEHVKEYWEKNTTIDRIDVNWNYCKENCRWATREEQSNNTTQNRLVDYGGEIMTIANFCKKCSVNYKSAHRKLIKWGEYLWAKLIN